jgi:hypothetical protein
MPAERIGSTPVAIRRFDVVGQDASSGEADFVGHIALAAESRLQIAGHRVPRIPARPRHHGHHALRPTMRRVQTLD